MKKPSAEKDTKKERIAKVLARQGVASRREVERMIAQGRIAVNGHVLTAPAFTVGAHDKIMVDNKPIGQKEKTRLWRYHKPEGLITTARDPQGRRTVFDHLPENLPRVISVGRLDLSSEGLLLLTNDGELARHLELPSRGWLRRYRARVHLAGQTISQEKLDTLKNGVTIEGVRYGKVEASLDHVKGNNAWVMISITEGKNREVRMLMQHLGFNVNRLIRLSFGPFQLGRLEKGAVEEIPPRVLHDQLADYFADKGP